MGSMPGVLDLLPLVTIMGDLDQLSLNGVASLEGQSLDVAGSLSGLIGGGE